MAIRRVRRVKKRRVDAPGSAASVAGPQADQAEVSNAARVVIIGNKVFNLKLAKSLQEQPELQVAGNTDSRKEALGFANEHSADLVVVDVDFGGTGDGIAFARTIHERSPDRAFLLVIGRFTTSVVRSLWVYGTDSWSVVTQATAQNPAHFAEAVSSAVRGMTWIEPGIERELSKYGPRPPSFEARRLAMFEAEQKSA